MTSTFTNVFTKPFNYEELKEVISKIQNTPSPKEWVLISPDGSIYKGNVEDIFPTLVKEHPIFKIDGPPFVLGCMGDD